MPLPSSGQISISAINTELGRASNTANTFLAGGASPAVGSLFWLGAQNGTINQTAPHAMSEWYGYSSNPIVTSGLALHLDAASPSSYPGSGTTWFDLSGFQRNVTLTNGPVWNSAGYFTLDGVNDFMQGSATNFGFDGNVGFSFQSVVMILNTAGRNFLISNQVAPNYQGISMEVGTVSGAWTNTMRAYIAGLPTLTTFDPRYSSNLIANNQIYIISAVINYAAKTFDTYLNGVLQTKTSFPTPNTPNNWNVNQTFYLGASPPDSIYGNLRYYHMMMYNRVLSSTEVTQNFNALRGRYGL